MSKVTNVILSCDCDEELSSRIAEVNQFFGHERGFGRMLDARTGASAYIGGSKNVDQPLYVAAFNYLNEKNLLDHLRTKVRWRHPHKVRCFMCGEQDDGFEERLQVPTEEL